jgi:hypothetical protein
MDVCRITHCSSIACKEKNTHIDRSVAIKKSLMNAFILKKTGLFK